MGFGHRHRSHRMPPAGERGNTSKASQRRPRLPATVLLLSDTTSVPASRSSRLWWTFPPWNAGRSQGGEEATTPLLKLRPRSPLQHVEQSLVFFLSKGRFQKSCRLLFLGIPTEQSFPLVLKLGGREEFI